MHRSAAIPSGPMRRREATGGAVHVGQVWLDEEGRRLFDELRELERKIFPKRPQDDETEQLTTIVRLGIEERVNRLRRLVQLRDECVAKRRGAHV